MSVVAQMFRAEHSSQSVPMFRAEHLFDIVHMTAYGLTPALGSRKRCPESGQLKLLFFSEIELV
jgi:hypothetical protein